MTNIALNFICKNEAHIVEKMLTSTLPIVDLIIANDTGSTDGTQDIIKKFGKKNNIPTFVIERPFDNFENSRNYALEKLYDVAKELSWDLDKSYGFWIDCDETLVNSSAFDKESLDKDLYMMNALINNMKYTRNTFIKLSKDFEWYGPVHEFLRPKSKDIKSGLIENMHVDVKMEGASWKGDIYQKYKDHALILEKYIDKDRSDPRWIFYTAQSYHDSSGLDDFKESEERLRRSMKYYKERLSRKDGHKEELFFSQFRIGTIMMRLEEPWSLTHQELLKAYSKDPLRGEPIKLIIDHYLRNEEWHNAYLYSKFAMENFHGKNPYPKRVLFLDDHLYRWKFLEVNSISSFYTGRKSEAKANYKELLSMVHTQPNLFTDNDIKKIKSNKKVFI
jgi:glycosyltransferase involved in cell wall biosynthesis